MPRINLTRDNIKDKIKSAFNKAEKSYDNNCQMQLLSGNKLIQLAQQYCSSSRNIIDLGCGTGIVTEKLANAIRYHEFHAIDFAADLLGKAYDRLVTLHIKTYEADFDCLPFYKDKFNIVFSNMALQWSANLSSTFLAINSLLPDDGIFVFSIPLPGTFTELNRHFSTNKFLSINQLIRRLTNAGYDVIHHETDSMTLRFPDTITTLKSIKLVGANVTSSKPSRNILSKSFFTHLNLTTLTYVTGYFVARKKLQPCQ